MQQTERINQLLKGSVTIAADFGDLTDAEAAELVVLIENIHISQARFQVAMARGKTQGDVIAIRETKKRKPASKN